MSDTLLPYYRTELEALRGDAAEFAKAYPKMAARLRIPANATNEAISDPHVERLLEGVAFLGARVQHRLDDEFPELTDALLSVLYPHYLAPFPSCLIAAFKGRAGADAAVHIKPGAMLETPSVNGETCRFRTTAAASVWPVEVEQVRLSGMPLPAPDNRFARAAVAVLHITLRCTTTGLSFEKLGLDRLRFFLGGPDVASLRLYELLSSHAISVAFARSASDPAPVIPSGTAITPIGFAADEALLPWTNRGFAGFRLLSEYFAFPHKFLFVELSGIPTKDVGTKLEVFVYLDQEAPDLARTVNARMLRLGCAPAINLFEMPCDPIPLDHTETEMLVVPDRRRQDALEVWSITGVRESWEGGSRPWRPFYRLTHGTGSSGPSYITVRRQSPAPLNGSDVYLAPCDPALDTDGVTASKLSIDALCTNRDLPQNLPIGGAETALRIVSGASGVDTVHAITPPSRVLRPKPRERRFWRLISHLALGHLSLSRDAGASTLKEVLRLYNLSEADGSEAAINALEAVAERPYAARVPGTRAGAFCRGLEVDLIFSAKEWHPLGLYLLASVLDRFLALHGQVNSFVRTRAMLANRPTPVVTWPPRAGSRVLL